MRTSSAILDAGISVLTSVNLEYIDEQQAFVEALTGRRRLETVPQAFIDGADEVVVVDAPPEAVPCAGGAAAMFSQLRQRALLLTADVGAIGSSRRISGLQRRPTRPGAPRSVFSSA